jgi:hypothetical protein
VASSASCRSKPLGTGHGSFVILASYVVVPPEVRVLPGGPPTRTCAWIL